jgi:putative endonuclease
MVGRNAVIATYIMRDRYRGTLYTGVTSQLFHRTWQHRVGEIDGFTKRYGLKRLVWYERRAVMTEAIQREKSIKRWPREWKINLIERDNPHWNDLYDEMMNWTPVPPQFDDWPSPPPPSLSSS